MPLPWETPGESPLPTPGVGGVPPGTKDDTGNEPRLPLSLQSLGGGVGMLVDADGDPVVGSDGMPILRSMDTPGTGGSAPAFSGTQAGQAQAQAAAAAQQAAADRAALERQMASDQAALDRLTRQEQSADERQLKQLAAEKAMLLLRIENSKRELLYGEIGATTRTIFQAQESERGRQQEMAGKDAFRFTATLRGKGAGTTPIDVFKQQGQQFVNQEIPSFSINDPLSTLEAGLQGLQKLSVAGAPQGLMPGMAQGGVIEMEQNDGAFTMKTARLVGEEGPEIMITDPQRKQVEIIPLSRGAATGGAFSFGNLDFGGFPDLTQFLRQSTGVSRVLPGFMSPSNVLPGEMASNLGARQRPLGSFVKLGNTKTVYMMTPEGLRSVGSPAGLEALGGSFGEVENLSMDAWKRLLGGTGRVDPFTLPEAEGFEMPLTGTPAFQASGQPLSTRRGFLQLAAVNPSFSTQDAINLSNQIGFLPAPHKIAREFPLLDPAEQAGIISLYELAGFPEGSFMSAIQSATPQGAFGGGQRIGFRGARF